MLISKDSGGRIVGRRVTYISKDEIIDAFTVSHVESEIGGRLFSCRQAIQGRMR